MSLNHCKTLILILQNFSTPFLTLQGDTEPKCLENWQWNTAQLSKRQGEGSVLEARVASGETWRTLLQEIQTYDTTMIKWGQKERNDYPITEIGRNQIFENNSETNTLGNLR